VLIPKTYISAEQTACSYVACSPALLKKLDMNTVPIRGRKLPVRLHVARCNAQERRFGPRVGLLYGRLYCRWFLMIGVGCPCPASFKAYHHSSNPPGTYRSNDESRPCFYL
jgi:hypothetical protein